MEPEQPNILIVFTDQQRWDTVGCYGQPLNTTPELDAMAAKGVRFEYAFTCQPVCGPARACVQTGKYATETGCFRNSIALPPGERTLAHWLSEFEYEVGYIGKWHLASTGGLGYEVADYRERPIPLERRGGYKDFWLAADIPELTSHGYDGHLFDAAMNRVEFRGYRADAVTDFALEYLGTRNRRSPFFLFLSYVEPHHQNDRGRYEGPVNSKERFKDYVPPGDLVEAGGDWAESYPDYLGCVNSIDGNLGRLRRELRSLGLAENTLMVFTSDHGSHFRTRNSEYKRSCHEGSIRIPMILCGPGFCGGQVRTELVSLIDIFPTVLAAAGIHPPSTARGRCLQDLVQHGRGDWPQEVFVQISESQVGRAIRTAKWKYSVSAPGKRGGIDPGAERYAEEFLYDLEHDPGERYNLIREPALEPVRDELRGTLVRRMVAAGEKGPVVEPAATP